MDKGRLIVFAGGGTGGHLYPAMSVAACLRELEPAIRVQFWATTRSIDRQVAVGAGHELIAQSVEALPRRPWQWPRFLLRWTESVRRCVQAFREDRPAVVVGAGGYAAGPPVRAAAKLGIPITLLNPDAVPGRANQHLASRAREVFVQWESSKRFFNTSTHVTVTGCPVRPSFLEAKREVGVDHFGLDPAKKTLLVTGASQGARTINEAMVTLWPRYARGRWQLLHLSGAADFEKVRSAHASADPTTKVVAFTDEMHLAVAAADLLVSRAGASTLAELTAAGRPSVLLPYPYHKDQHQLANANELASAGAAEIVIDRKDAAANAEALGAVLDPLLSEDSRLQAMAAAAKSLGRPEAGQTVAQRLLSFG